MDGSLAGVRLWLKPCPRCRAAQLLEQQDGILTRITCVTCSYVLTASERRVLNERMLDGGPEQMSLTAASGARPA